MTREMEERIVAMYFDNEDFEKKAKTTIETLGQLQKGLDLKESAKGFEVFDKIGKTLNFEKAQKGLTKIKTTLNGMTGIFKKVFNLGPIDEAAAAVENFKNRYLNRVLGFDLARSVANSLESAFRGLTIQPVSAGWTQYQNKMDSVKTIMSSTGESIETVEKHLQSLTTYANKTIYSLSDMTSNLGKFTNNGMKLEDSVLAMQGIANAAADAGQGAQQASMAMYNFSQAMGVGKMTTIDWKSIENANMATTRLKDTFIEMAAAQGELHKEFSETDKKYHYYITKNSKGQVEKDQKKWTEVTAKNFRETLSKDWLTAEAMMHALMVYSGEALDPDTIKSWGITDPELIKSFTEIGQNALKAATEVRTFGKMMDALKESAQSGWADTFELIFGNMEQGTTLWTGINEVLDGILSKSAEARNNMLKIWAGSSESTEEEEEEVKSKTESLKALEEYLAKLEEETDIDKTTAKIDELRASIQHYKEEITDLRKGQNKGNKESTQAQIDRRLKKIEELEASVTELEQRNKKNKAAQKNQDTMKDLEEQIRAYQAEIQTLRNADAIDSETNADASAKRQKQITEKENKMKELQKKLDKLRAETGVDEIEKTRKEIENLKKEIEELNGVIDEKNSKPKSEFVDEKGRSGRDILFDRETGALFQLIDLAKEFGKTFSDAFHSAFGFMDAEKLFNMTRDFGKAVERVVEWFTKANDEGSRMDKIRKGLQGVFSILKTVVNFVKMGFNLIKRLVAPVADFMVNAFEKIFGFFDGLGNLKPVEVFQKLGEGLKTVWDKVKKFFSPKDVLDANGKATGKKELPVITWLKETWNGLKSTVREWANDVGLGDVYNNVAQWWETFKTSINTAFEGIQTWWDGTGIADFFSNMWNSITGAFQPKANVVSGYRNGRFESWYEEAPIVTWLTGIWDGVKSVWDSIIGWEGWTTIATFASDTWGWIKSRFTSSGNVVSGYRNGRLESWYEEAPIVTWLTGIWDGVKSVWDSIISWDGWTTIATFASNTWGWIKSRFTSSGNVVSDYRNGRLESWYEEAPIVSWLSGILDGVKTVWDDVVGWEGWTTIATFASDTWGWIKSRFTSSGNVVSGYRNGRLESWYEEAPIVTWLTGIWDGVKSVWDSIISWDGWTTIATFASNTWGWIKSRFTSSGNVVSGYRNGRLESWYEEAPIVTWLTGIWDGVKSVWDSIISWDGWGSIGEFLSNTWGWITGLFSGSAGSIAGASQNAVDVAGQMVEAADKSTLTPEETEQGLNFFQRIMAIVSDFITKVVTYVKDTVIPPEVTTFIVNLSDVLKGIMKAVSDVLGSFGKWFNNGWGSKGWTKEDTWNILLTIFGLIGTIATNLITSKWVSKLSAVNNIGSQFLMFAGGVLMIASAVAMISTVDPTRLGAAFGVVEVIALTIGGFIAGIAKLTSGTSSITSTPVERFFTNLVNKLASFATIAIILKEIPTIIKAISAAKTNGVNNVGEDLLKIAESVALLFSAITISMAVVNKIGGTTGIDPVATASTLASFIEVFAVVSAIVLAVGGIGEAVDGIFGDNSHEAVIGALNKAAEFFQGLGNALGGFVMGLFGVKSDKAKTMEALDMADMLAKASEAFNAEKISGLSRMMTLITNLSTDTAKINTGRMSDFAVAMGNLGDGVYTIASYVSEVEGPLSEMHNPDSIQYKKLEGVLGFAARLGEAFSKYAHFVDTTSYKTSGFTGLVKSISELADDAVLDQLTMTLSKMMTKFSTDLPNGDTISFDGIEIVKKLYDAIQLGLNSGTDLPTFDATSIVDAIVLALTAGDEAIAQIVHDMVQNGLNLSASKEDPYKLPEGSIEIDPGGTVNPFGNKSNGGTLVNLSSLDLSTLSTDTEEYNKLFGSLGETLNNFNLNIPNLNETLDKNGWNSLFSFESEEGSEDSVLSELQKQMAMLSESISEVPDKFEITITPVFDMTNMTPEKLQAAFDNQFMNNPLLAKVAVNNPASGIDFANLKTDLGLDDIKNKLAEMYQAIVLAGNTNVIAINGLKTNVDGVADAVAGMKLVLDTGVLVGQITPMIDVALGQRSWIYGRTGVIFTKP